MAEVLNTRWLDQLVASTSAAPTAPTRLSSSESGPLGIHHDHQEDAVGALPRTRTGYRYFLLAAPHRDQLLAPFMLNPGTRDGTSPRSRPARSPRQPRPLLVRDHGHARPAPHRPRAALAPRLRVAVRQDRARRRGELHHLRRHRPRPHPRRLDPRRQRQPPPRRVAHRSGQGRRGVDIQPRRVAPPPGHLPPDVPIHTIVLPGLLAPHADPTGLGCYECGAPDGYPACTTHCRPAPADPTTRPEARPQRRRPEPTTTRLQRPAPARGPQASDQGK